MSTALALSASADWQDTESTASQLIQMAFLAREAEAAMPMPEGQQWQGQGQGQELAQGQEQLAQELPLQQSHKNECKSSKPNKHTKKHKHKHAHKPYGSKPSTAKLQQSVAAEQHELRHRQYIVTRICGEKKDAQGRSLFQVQWRGYRKKTWEPLECLTGCEQALADFRAECEARAAKLKRGPKPAKPRTTMSSQSAEQWFLVFQDMAATQQRT